MTTNMSNHEARTANPLYSFLGCVQQALTVGNSTLLVVTVLTLLTYWWVTCHWPTSFERMRDESCPLPLPPGTMGWPFIGETLEYARKGSEFFSWRLDHYGKVYKTHLLGRPMVRVVGADNVQRVLTGEHVTVSSHWPWSVRRLVGPHSLLGMASDRHRLVKPVIAALFTPRVLASFVPRIQAVVRQHLERWCQTSREQGHVLGFPACQQLSLDLSLQLVLGVGVDGVHREGLSGAMRQFVACLFSLPLVLPGTGVWKGLRARERILQVIRQKLHSSQSRDDVDFLSIVELMQERDELAHQPQVIEDNALELFFAGYSTTSSALCSALLCLGRNPQVLSKVEAELNEYGLLEDPSVELTYDVIRRLQYIHCVNNEVLRLYPPAGAGFRKALKTLQIGGFQIPKDWTVAYSIRETQQTSELFPDPHLFLPDRWLGPKSEELQDQARYHYIPFGLGARACVGRRLAVLYQAVFLAEVVRGSRYRLKNPVPAMKFIPVAKPADDLPVTFRRRGSDAGFASFC